MSSHKKLWIALIPAYEPTPLLLELLQEVRAQGFEAVVIDDGSGADFADLFCQAAEYATVLHHAVNRGKGCAIKTGLAHIQEHFGTDCVVAVSYTHLTLPTTPYV